MVRFEYTSSNPAPVAGPTAQAITKPLSISKIDIVICGIATITYGIAELHRDAREVACLWLLHPRPQSQACMAPFAAQFIHAWNRRDQSGRKGLIAISFDQRNHGAREVSPTANGDWRSGNSRHAQDMFGCYQGTSADTSQLLDHVGSYLCPEFLDDCVISQNIVFGISLGGHAAWQVILHDPRFTSAIIAIGCPDFTRLMYERARSNGRKSWHETQGRTFVGSSDFPPGLMTAVQRSDPAGVLFNMIPRGAVDQLDDRVHHCSDHVVAGNKALMTLSSRHLRGKRILNLSGGADRLVPYNASKPFLDRIKEMVNQSSVEDQDNLCLVDTIVPGVKHQVCPAMVEYAEKFLLDTLTIEKRSDVKVPNRIDSKI